MEELSRCEHQSNNNSNKTQSQWRMSKSVLVNYISVFVPAIPLGLPVLLRFESINHLILLSIRVQLEQKANRSEVDTIYVKHLS